MLLIGGASNKGVPVATTEVFNESTGAWEPAGALKLARSAFTATLLPNGTVLVAGGFRPGQMPGAGAELYNSVTRTWTLTGSMNYARARHSATLLPNGKVLVTGGVSTSSAELYDPATGRWTITAALALTRDGHTATCLPSGRVLIAGGGFGLTFRSGTEIYHWAGATWSSTGGLSEHQPAPAPEGLGHAGPCQGKFTGPIPIHRFRQQELPGAFYVIRAP